MNDIQLPTRPQWSCCKIGTRSLPWWKESRRLMAKLVFTWERSKWVSPGRQMEEFHFSKALRHYNVASFQHGLIGGEKLKMTNQVNEIFYFLKEEDEVGLVDLIRFDKTAYSEFSYHPPFKVCALLKIQVCWILHICNICTCALTQLCVTRCQSRPSRLCRRMPFLLKTYETSWKWRRNKYDQ